MLDLRHDFITRWATFFKNIGLNVEIDEQTGGFAIGSQLGLLCPIQLSPWSFRRIIKFAKQKERSILVFQGEPFVNGYFITKIKYDAQSGTFVSIKRGQFRQVGCFIQLVNDKCVAGDDNNELNFIAKFNNKEQLTSKPFAKCKSYQAALTKLEQASKDTLSSLPKDYFFGKG